LQQSLGWSTRTFAKPGFWFLAALVGLITISQYVEQLHPPASLARFLSDLGLERHAFERIAYLVPIIWAGFIFEWRGAFVTSLVTLSCMLPGTILLSTHSREALIEAGSVFALGNVAFVSFDALRRGRKRRSDLRKAENALQFQLQVIKDSEKRLAALNQTSATLSQSLELQEVLDKATETVMTVMQVDAVLIHLMDEEAGELSLASHRGVSAEFAQLGEKIRLGESSSGQVAQTGEPLFVEDASQYPTLSSREIEVARSQGIHSLLSVPLKSKRKVMGTLSVLMHEYRWFREDEVELLTAIGNQIGVAVENARLYEKERLATQRLAISERNYRGLFENANDAIWVHDLEGNITVANRACETQTGYLLEELTTMNVRNFLPQESHALAMEVRRKLLEKQSLEQPYEQRIIRKDGSEAILMLTTSLVVEDGVPVGFQNIARDVTEEKRMRENLSFYLREVTKAQEEERKRIALELHDDTIQALVVLSRQLDNLASSSKGLSASNRALLENLWQQINNTIQGVRRLSQDLRPPILDRLGLLPALEWLVSDVSGYSGIRIKTRVLGSERRLPQEAELMLFRIVQEVLRNVWRHSEATEADLTVQFDGTRIRITVADNGKGFELPSSVGDLTRSGKLGLAGMQERARLLGGNMKMESEPGKGTTVTVETPT
jgi:PAS domain S-box-containing protein